MASASGPDAEAPGEVGDVLGVAEALVLGEALGDAVAPVLAEVAADPDGLLVGLVVLFVALGLAVGAAVVEVDFVGFVPATGGVTDGQVLLSELWKTRATEPPFGTFREVAPKFE